MMVIYMVMGEFEDMIHHHLPIQESPLCLVHVL